MQHFIDQINLHNKDSLLNYFFLKHKDSLGMHQQTIDVFYKQKWISFEQDSTYPNGLSNQIKKQIANDFIQRINNQMPAIKKPKFTPINYIENSSNLTADMMRWILTKEPYDENSWEYRETIENEKHTIYQIDFGHPIGFGHMCTVFYDRFVYQSDIVNHTAPHWRILDEPLDLKQDIGVLYEKVTGRKYDDYDHDGVSFVAPKEDTELNLNFNEKILAKKLNLEMNMNLIQNSLEQNKKLIEANV